MIANTVISGFRILTVQGAWRRRSWRERFLPGWLAPFEPWISHEYIPPPLSDGEAIIDEKHGVIYMTTSTAREFEMLFGPGAGRPTGIFSSGKTDNGS